MLVLNKAFGDTDGIIIALLGGTKPVVINPHGPGDDPEAFRLLKAFTEAAAALGEKFTKLA